MRIIVSLVVSDKPLQKCEGFTFLNYKGVHMKALVVTNKHGMYGMEIEVQSAAKAQHYVDDQNRLYHINDIVNVEDVEHEFEKALTLTKYWNGVVNAIKVYEKL